MKYKLLIKPNNEEVNDFYSNHGYFNEGDSGLDLFIPEDIEIKCGETKMINLQIKCEMFDTTNETPKNVSYYLYARSSISKTPLILKNSVGIVDAGYRGNLMAALYYAPTSSDLINNYSNSDELPIYKIDKGTRLIQICTKDLEPLQFQIVEDLTDTERGEQGIGSTGI